MNWSCRAEELEAKYGTLRGSKPWIPWDPWLRHGGNATTGSIGQLDATPEVLPQGLAERRREHRLAVALLREGYTKREPG
eukprot:2653210-Amphidinium_carterae.1